MGVGERPEMLDSVPSASSERENGNGSGRRPKKGATRRRGGAAAQSDVEVPVAGTSSRNTRDSRERSLHRLLAGLRAVNAGDFSVRLTSNGDPLMADIIDVFNSVTHKQARLVDEIARVSGSVGREGKMQDRVAIAGVGGQWVDGDRLGKQSDRRSRAADDRSLTRDKGRRRGRSVAEGGVGDRRETAARRVLPDRVDREPNGRPV